MLENALLSLFVRVLDVPELVSVCPLSLRLGFMYHLLYFKIDKLFYLDP